MTISSFNQLKNNRQKELDRLTSTLDKLASNGKSNDDELYWKPTPDKAGNASATIRFLPAGPTEEIPFVRLWSHSFQGVGGWYIENSRTTLEEDDPVSELNSQLWSTGIESNKDIARVQKRKLHYISNIYVIRDPANPENEGKVFYYKFGKKIFTMINDLLHPQFEDEKKINAFDFWEGANFKLKMRKVEGYPNYDKSEFEPQSPLFTDDDKMEALWKSLRPLKPLVAPENFKSYDELKTKLSRVLGNQARTPSQRIEKEATAAPVEQKSMPEKVKVTPPWEGGDSEGGDDEGLAFFKNMAKDD
jgi:hypothetical protein